MGNEEPEAILNEVGTKDHSVTSEYRVFGPPGTGKTTAISRQIQRAVDRFGPESILVTSFSRTAAAELAGRDLPIHSDRIGTLHSLCYRALGCPVVAECRVSEWNRKNPHWALTRVGKPSRLDGEDAVEDDAGGERPGDRTLQQLNWHRGMMIPASDWPRGLREFGVEWSGYKRWLGTLDFADLIEHCLRDVSTAPWKPSVIFADEGQDLNPMQLALVRKWGGRANYFILGGDDDQCIFTFAGASPDGILAPAIPDDHKIVLRQSYRVPRAVHRVADRLIQQVEHRQSKPYRARPAEGAVVRLAGTYESAEYGILKTAEQHLKEGKTIMFLATCSYMLRPVVAALRKRGLPFHNPYRKSNGFWNPLRIGRKASATGRVLALLSAHPSFGRNHRPWTYRDIELWTEVLATEGILKPGAREALSGRDPRRAITADALADIFEPGVVSALTATLGSNDCRSLLDWWLRRLPAGSGRHPVRFPADVAAMHGADALLNPNIVVGTVHSIKGGQADVVYLFPDLSQAADSQYRRRGTSRDAVIRVLYVGITRARETLYICQPTSMLAASI
ncbi:MAG: ATP-dependent helicase [Bryobacterales bacterium]|nr:ATP-dependent helicase [Bryobacterales bacterium]